MKKIDLKDKRIIKELDMNSRISLSELSKKVNLSRQGVEYRIKQLKKKQIIYGELTIFDLGIIGYNYYRVVFRLKETTKEDKENFINFIETNNKVFWLGEIGGNWDIIVNFASRDHYEFNNLFENLVSKFGKFILDYEVLTYVNIYDLSREFILEEKNQVRKEFFHEMKLKKNYNIDNLDLEIIKIIGTNATISYVELGNQLNVSANTIKNRIKNMEKNKLILGYRTFINPTSIHRVPYMLFLEITKLNLEREKELYHFLRSIDCVTFIVKHIGRWRIGMEIEATSVEHFQEIFVKIRGEFSDLISNYESFPLFRDRIVNYFPVGLIEEE